MTQPGGLGEQLSSLRKAAGLTAGQLAERLGWRGSTGRTKISKIENNHQWLTAEEVRAWAAACGRPDVAEDLVVMLTDAQTTYRSARGALRQGFAPVQQDFDQLVQATSLIRNSAPNVIPSFVQTGPYARSLFTQASALWPAKDIDAAVQARLGRQAVLYDPSKTFQFVITEAALRLLPCPPDVMLGQLAWLERFLSLGLGNVTLGIIPMGTQLAVMPTADFLLLDDQVLVEVYAGDVAISPEEAPTYVRIFELLLADARTGADARHLITAAADELRAQHPNLR